MRIVLSHRQQQKKQQQQQAAPRSCSSSAQGLTSSPKAPNFAEEQEDHRTLASIDVGDSKDVEVGDSNGDLAVSAHNHAGEESHPSSAPSSFSSENTQAIQKPPVLLPEKQEKAQRGVCASGERREAFSSLGHKSPIPKGRSRSSSPENSSANSREHKRRATASTPLPHLKPKSAHTEAFCVQTPAGREKSKKRKNQGNQTRSPDTGASDSNSGPDCVKKPAPFFSSSSKRSRQAPNQGKSAKDPCGPLAATSDTDITARRLGSGDTFVTTASTKPPPSDSSFSGKKRASKMGRGHLKKNSWDDFGSNGSNENNLIDAGRGLQVRFSGCDRFLDDRQQPEDPAADTGLPSESLRSSTGTGVKNHLGSANDSSFEAKLKKCGLEMVEQEGDGNCLFRAVSLQVYGDASMHGEVRKRCLDFMARDQAHFSHFVTGEPFQDYIDRKRRDGVHGNNPEIQAISELFNRPVEVFVPEFGAKPINIFHAEYKTADAPIRLSYHDGNHYNAVVDPLCPTAGLGLGLPGLEPGLADRMQVKKAMDESDRIRIQKLADETHNAELQRVLHESKSSVDHMYKEKALALSDIEATDFELEQAVLASSLESYRVADQGRKQPSSYRDRRRQQGSISPPLPSDSVFMNDGALGRSVHRQDDSSSTSFSSAAVAAPAAAVASYESESPSFVRSDGSSDEYPEMVQELVMNGFELSKVLHAYELIGENFDDILAFLMSSGR